MRHSLLLALVFSTQALGPGRVLPADVPARRPRVERVIVVFKTHFDLGYTDLARNVVTKYRTTMIDKALEVCDAARDMPPDRRFVWTLSGWPMTQILWPGQSAERRERTERAIREGRLVWHALPATLHTESLNAENIVRGLEFSSRLSREFGLPLPHDAKMTDVPSHSWILPTILTRAGISFLHLGCNPVSASPDLPPLFWWEGPDGSRLLTMYSAQAYGTGLEPPEGWPHRTWLALIHTGDNHGPPTRSEVQELLEKAREKLPGVEVKLGRLSDFGDAILEENPDLPVVRADMPDSWIHGIESMPVETKMARNLRPAIGSLESLNTLLSLWGVEVAPATVVIDKAYELSLLYGEHTWGASSWNYVPRLYGEAWEKARASGKYAHAEASWREHGAYIRSALKLVAPQIAANMEALAAAVSVEGPRIVVYNPLPWARDDVVCVSLREGMPESWKDAETGAAAPSEIDGKWLRLLVTRVPSLGYRTLIPAAAGACPRASSLVADLDRGVFENEYFRLRIRPGRGGIVSLLDKRTGRELADPGAGYRLGQYLYERFDRSFHEAYLKAYCKKFPNWAHEFGKAGLPPAGKVPYAALSPERFRVSVRRGPVSVSVLGRSPPGSSLRQDIEVKLTLYRGLPWVDFEWTIRGKKPDPWPEAGWLCFPFAVQDPVFRLGRPGADIDPARDTVPSSNHEVYCIDTGVLMTSKEGVGIGLCPLDSPLVSLGSPGVFRFSRRFQPRKPVVLVNLFNNEWGTNFQQWCGGSWSSRVRVWAVQGRGIEADLVTPSLQARRGCLVAFAGGPAGPLNLSRSGMQLSRRGIRLTAFGRNPDGEGLLLRLWEQAGVAGVCTVRLPGGLDARKAQPCDLRGRPVGEPIDVIDGRVRVPLERYAPASLLLDPR